MIVSLVGTDLDPQGLAAQRDALVAAGAEVHLSNAAATRRALDLLSRIEGSVPVSETTVVTVGADMFADAVAGQAVAVERVDWRPPMPGTEADLAAVATDPRRPEANRKAVEAMLGVTAHLVDVAPASEVLGLEPGQFLHAGPPIEWDRTSGPLRGALMGGAALEGLVDDPEDAVALFESGSSVSLEPCHHRSAVGPMAGVVTPSMWMWVLEDRATGARTYCSLNEGLGKVLRYGAYGPEVLTRLRWMGDVLGPLLQAAVRGTRRGDRRHRHPHPDAADGRRGPQPQPRRHPDAAARPRPRDGRRAASTPQDVAEALRFVGGNDHFFLNLAMPACKLALDAGRDVPGSTMVVAMARNGTDFGIQVSGTGDEWFTGPAQVAEGLFLGDYGPDDANADIGDSAITETAGIGGFAMATAPAIVRLVGGSVPDALATTRRMHEITLAENPRWTVPVLEFQGTPDRHRREQGLPHRDPAADQHRHGRSRRRRRPGRRRAGHPARGDLPEGAGRPGSPAERRWSRRPPNAAGRRVAPCTLVRGE